jgi:MFS family permease
LKPAQRWTLIAAILGSGCVFLDSSVVNVALPQIGRQLPVHLFGVLEGQTYVYSGYLLSLSALLILAGAINDYYGRRRVFAIGLVSFGLTSVLCGLAPNLELLVAFRFLQGAAGALLVPGSLSLIAAAFTGPDQARAYGIWAGATSGATLLGPFVGGVLVDTVSWRAVFLLNIPLVALALYAVLRQWRRAATRMRRLASTGWARRSWRWPSAASLSARSTASSGSGAIRSLSSLSGSAPWRRWRCGR